MNILLCIEAHDNKTPTDDRILLERLGHGMVKLGYCKYGLEIKTVLFYIYTFVHSLIAWGSFREVQVKQNMTIKPCMQQVKTIRFNLKLRL